MNILRTAFLMALLTALFVFVGFLIGGKAGMLIAFGVAAAMNFIAYWNSDKAVLAMYRAQEVDEHSAPELVHLVRQLSEKAGLPMPKVYIADNPQPNAFATGRNPQHAAVCATSGILQRLSKEELAGVLAHELSHVKNRDTLTMTITATLAGAVSMLANFAFFMGGNRRNNPLGLVGMLLVMIVAPHCRGAGADGDQPQPRVRGRSFGRAVVGTASVACLPRSSTSTTLRSASKTRTPKRTPRPRTCSSPIPCRAADGPGCSRPSAHRRTDRAASGDGRANGRGASGPGPMELKRAAKRGECAGPAGAALRRRDFVRGPAAQAPARCGDRRNPGCRETSLSRRGLPRGRLRSKRCAASASSMP